MFPSSQNPDAQRNGGGDLENRLRDLILNNANETTAPAFDPQHSTPSYIPLSMSSVPPTKQPFRVGFVAQPLTSSSLPPVSAGGPPAAEDGPGLRPPLGHEDQSSVPRPSPQQGRKRLNQAQRRQMNSQLSVPQDARQDTGPPVGQRHPPLDRSGLQGYASSQSSNQPQANYNPRHLQQQQYSPRFPNQNPAPNHPHRTGYSQPYRQPPTNYNPSGPNPGYGPQHVQAPNQAHQYQAANHHGQGSPFSRPPPSNRQLYQPNQYNGQGRGRQFIPNPEEIANQSSYLSTLLQDTVPVVGIDAEEEAEKESFRAVVENACRDAILQYEQEELVNPAFDASSVELKCFGSMSSGFATRASDMDLALLTPLSRPAADSPESPIPRVLEKKLLSLGYGARLLTRTRVPIIKLCQTPTPKLLSGLLEARAKWENGFITEAEEEDEEAVEADLNPHTKEAQPSRKKKASADSPELPSTDILLQNPSPTDVELAKLKQKSNQSLSDYFNTTKRVLRKVGGRDISVGAPALSAGECNLLNEICKAFISGLLSQELIMGLRASQNVLPLFDSSLPPIQRSLNGLWSQVEGERLALAFDCRTLLEANERHEQECTKLIEEWRSLQNQTARLVEPLTYNRQLYMTAEKLKSFSSLQLVLLEQIQHEDPFYYQKRAQKIHDDLMPRHSPNSVTAVVTSRYICGILDPQIRKAMMGASTSMGSIKNVATKHRILQLAIDYEHALNKNLYDDSDQPVVLEYITYLRNQSLERHIEPALIAKIRALPDPMAISVNKPRDRYRDELEFPKTDVGIQCDINFAAHLALHNTLLLRCYSHSDLRVKPLILFIKHWAKIRGINTPYRGSLSSYGYVLMVLHYLVNVVQPFVCPNLQLLHKEPSSHLSPAEIDARITCMGRDVRFWRNESEISDLSRRGMLNHNHDSFGMLLRGFFEYFAQSGQMSTVQGRGFDWGREVLSLRTQGGTLSKAEKGWVGAKTVIETTTVAAPLTTSNPTQSKDSGDADQSVTPDREPEVKSTNPQVKTVEETKEIRHRYLFAIEDPFELDHNVARTVTHNGIVSIRDEFRRAWRLIKNIGRPGQNEALLDPVKSGSENQPGLQELLDLIHGSEGTGTKVA